MKSTILLSAAIAGSMLLASSAVSADGAAVYNSGCAACHGPGIAGAPKVGDKDAWKDRVGKDKEELYSNAINGYQGSAGVMPAKGGFTHLSDDDVKLAVDHMVAESM